MREIPPPNMAVSLQQAEHLVTGLIWLGVVMATILFYVADHDILVKRRKALMIDVFALNGAKELLTKMTPAERGLLLLFGYASNQVHVLWKLVTIATNETPDNPIEQRVNAAQHRYL